MKNNIKMLTIIFSLMLLSNLSAQHGGNHIYEDNYAYKRSLSSGNRIPVETKSIYSTDTSLFITTKVLLNKSAEFYIITIGVNSIAKTVVEANQITNKKIENVIDKIKALGIAKKDIFIDFVAETKMYDHRIEDREIVEYFDGFSIRKNLIIKTSQQSNIDKIVDYCSEQEIYDIIKVDYISEDLEKISMELLDEALKISKNKTKNFSDNSSIQLTDNYRIVSESFKIYYPKNLYKQYNEAFETSKITNHYSGSYITKEVRKERTFYYDGIETEIGVDKIIDRISPVIGIQYVMELVIRYDLKKQ